jgi:hypothetical protein
VNADAVAERYRRFAERECRGTSETYYRLALAVAEDGEITGFLAGLPDTQPNLFFAAVQLLTGPHHMPANGAGLRTLVTERREELGTILRSRRTQTNEVGRCAVLLPALPPGPLALVEVGASAGLCLLLDRFRYDFGSTQLGDPASPVLVRCAVRGNAPLPSAPPHVVWRRGLDARPIDVHDDDAVRWLLACVWSDHAERRERLRTAIDLARTDPPAVVAGDLVDDLPALLAQAPDGAQLVVFHSAVLSYVAPARRAAFVDVLAETSKRRSIVWLSNEGPGVVAEMTASAPPSTALRFLLGRMRFANGRREDELLADSHPHGAELTWW